MVPVDARCGQDVMVLVKLSAARTVIGAVLQGRLHPDPDLVVAVAGLVGAAAHHAALAEKVAA